MTNLQMEVSCFPNIQTITNPKTLPLPKILDGVKSGRWKDQQDRVRNMRAVWDADPESKEKKKAYKSAKHTLPAVTISGVFSKRNNDSLLQHSGALQLDFDGDDNPGWTPEKMREVVAADPFTYSAGISLSGDGVKGIALIPADTDQHLDSFLTIQAHFRDSYGLEMDSATKDISRPCFVWHDPELVIKEIESVKIVEPIKNDSPLSFKYQEASYSPPMLNSADQVEPITLADAAPKRSLEDATEALKSIKDIVDRPEYDDRLGILSGMFNSYGQAGYDAVQEVFGKDGFDKPIKHLTKRHTAGTVFHMAKGLCGVTDIPDYVFPVPAGGVGNNASAEIIFPAMGKMKRLFMRGSSVHEIVKGHEAEYLAPLSPERFCSLVEDAGKRVARKEVRKDKDTGVIHTIWRSTTFPVSSAKILLETDASRKHLPPIRQIVNCPIMTAEGEVLTRGYHAHSGGTYIGAGHNPEEVLFGTAVRALFGILEDFEFAAKSDLSRAFASLISPALKMGGWIKDDFPLDLAEATESQSGKTFRQKLVCRIYNEVPTSITLARGGVGSIDESISAALVKGRPFVTLANMRGKIDSTILEEALRGSGRVTCRTLRNSTEVDCQPFLWQFSTNGAELTRDLANRAIVTRIRKKPAGYSWKKYPEGDLEQHIQSNQSFYLGCVFSIISKWDKEGRSSTKESRHDFRGWCRALDGIVQLCGLEPLLDGHREQQERTANPQLQWLREIILAVKPEQHGEQLFTHDLTEIAEECGIEFPGNPYSKDEPYIKAGRILGKIFRDAEGDSVEVDGFSFSRIEEPDYSPEGKGYITKKYTIKAL